MQVLLALTTNWGDIGSVDQYVKWCGGLDHTDFYTNPSCIQMYNAHTDKITSRVNTINGRRRVPQFLLMRTACARDHVLPEASWCGMLLMLLKALS